MLSLVQEFRAERSVKVTEGNKIIPYSPVFKMLMCYIFLLILKLFDLVFLLFSIKISVVNTS